MPSADLETDSSSAHCKSSLRHDSGKMPSPNPLLFGIASSGQGTASSRSALAAERTASRMRSGSPARLDTITLGGTSHPALESTWGVNICHPGALPMRIAREHAHADSCARRQLGREHARSADICGTKCPFS